MNKVRVTKLQRPRDELPESNQATEGETLGGLIIHKGVLDGMRGESLVGHLQHPVEEGMAVVVTSSPLNGGYDFRVFNTSRVDTIVYEDDDTIVVRTESGSLYELTQVTDNNEEALTQVKENK